MTHKKHILLICDCYCLSTSGGKLIRDLEVEILKRDFGVTVLHQRLSKGNLANSATNTKRIRNNLRRGIDEIVLSLLLSFKVLTMANSNYIGVISYSPSIFLFIPALVAKMKFKIKYYLITRDIFPQWLLQSNVINDGLVYKILLKVSRMSYLAATHIGLQSNTDKDIVDKVSGRNLVSEVLENWRSIDSFEKHKAKFKRSNTTIKILYAGNVGEAQRLDDVFEHLLSLNDLRSVEIAVYGFGRVLESLKNDLDGHPYNSRICFHAPVTEEELYKISTDFDFGLVALDSNLVTGNIPGKILTYLNFELPLLGVAKEGSELEFLIKTENIGVFLSYNSLTNTDKRTLLKKVTDECEAIDRNNLMNCLVTRFSTKVASTKILSKFIQ